MNKLFIPFAATAAWFGPRFTLFALILCGSTAYAQECAVGGDTRARPTTHCDPGAAPASHPNSDPTTGTGLSIDLVSGNKYLVQTDAVWPGGLILRRHYNSLNGFEQSMGPSWRHSFDTVLAIRTVPAKDELPARVEAQVIQGDGRRIVFQGRPQFPGSIGKSGASGKLSETSKAGEVVTGDVGSQSKRVILAALNPVYGAIRIQPDISADRRFVWRWRDGSSLYFSQAGKLTAAERSNGQLLQFQYRSLQSLSGQKPVSRLVRVSNRHGQALHFHYNAKNRQLSQVVLPDSSAVHYQYDRHGVLLSVNRGGSRRWTFEYSDDRFSALTTIRDGDNNVKGIYRYNRQGRVTFSSPTAKSNDSLAISVRYQLPAQSDKPGLSVVTDAQSRTTRYRWQYNPQTQARQMLSAVGPGCQVCPATGLRRGYDQQGRPRVLRDDAGKVIRRWHYDAIGRLSDIVSSRGGAEPTRRRFIYASQQFDAPVVEIRSDSVAPGKSRRWKLRYNALGLVVQVTQTGFAPDLRSLRNTAGKNQPAAWTVSRWRRMRRDSYFQYVDTGPAQGLVASVDGPLPGSADTTVMHYDRAGQLARVVGPGQSTMTYEYDNHGRTIARRNDRGQVWRYDYSETNDGLQRTTVHLGVTTIERINHWGQLVALSRSDQPALTMTYDPLGLLQKITNVEGQWLSRSGLGLGPDKVIRLTPPRRLHRPDQRVVVSGSRAVATRRRAGSGEVEHIIRDDFGRAQAVVDSESGVTFRVYDMADRLIASAFSGNNEKLARSVRLYRYDKRGNLTGITDGDGSLVKNQYQNGLLSGQEQRFQSVQLSASANKRDHRWSIRYRDPVSGVGFTSALTFGKKFDEYGRLSTRKLPGGWAIKYRWTRTNRLTSIVLISPSGKRETLASGMRWLPFTGGQRGLLFARFGNGTLLDIELDNQLRVTRLTNGHGQPTQSLAYDWLGRTALQRIDGVETSYRYNRHNHLVSWHRRGDEQVSTTSQSGRRSALWATDRAGRVRWSWGPSIGPVRYIYNLQLERIGKVNIHQPSTSRWFVYDQKRLAMETNATGQPLIAYLYLDGRPFVMLRFDSSGAATPYWVHTDHRGLPLTVTNVHGQRVWTGRFDPYGQRLMRKAGPGQPDTAASVGEAVRARLKKSYDRFMPLRLPGQYYEADTGLHDNYQRTYDPVAGAYLGPDPLGMRPGAGRYDYARGSPMDTTDPLGLYEIDVHYYMTYFLARMAGIEHTDANVIAHAAQGIDDNPATRPTDPGPVFGQSPLTPLVNQHRLRSYHFVLYHHWEVAPGLAFLPSHGSPQTADPHSWQLSNLLRSVNSAVNGCTRMQLLGEMLHAYEDTYAHRDALNFPISAVNRYGLGTGHMFYAHYPDYTYNPNWIWRRNEERTWQMEQDTYQQLLQHGNRGLAISPDQFQSVVRAFNNTRENHETGFDQKLALLDRFMRDNGIMVDTESGAQSARFLPDASGQLPTVRYVSQNALDARNAYLCGQTYNTHGTISPRCR